MLMGIVSGRQKAWKSQAADVSPNTVRADEANIA